MRHYFLDRVVELEPGTRAVGVRSVSLSDDTFTDHFPGNPVLPGVHLLEGMAQLAGVLLTKTHDGQRIALMASVDRARFSAFARPGDTVRFTVDLEQQSQDAASVRAAATVGEKRIAQARLTFKLLHPDQHIPVEYQPYWKRMIATWCGEFPGDPNV